MSPRVFLKVTEGGKVFIAVLAVKRLAIVQSEMSAQPIASVESLLATILRTFEGLLFRVDTDVDFQAVGGEKSLTTALFRALETVLAWNGNLQWNILLFSSAPTVILSFLESIDL